MQSAPLNSNKNSEDVLSKYGLLLRGSMGEIAGWLNSAVLTELAIRAESYVISSLVNTIYV